MHFEELVNRISPKLKGITYRLNSRSTFFNDEDLFQEALIHLWHDFGDGKLADKTDSYILQGCYFYLKNYLRKQNSRYRLVSLEQAIDDEDTAFEDFLADENAASLFDQLNAKMVTEAIRNNGLTTKEKDILFLYADGLTTREIGARFGVSHVSIVKAMNMIRHKCKKHIDIL